MINTRFDFKTVKRNFFDKASVKRHVDKRTRKVLSRFGAYVRRTAKESIRRRRAISSPGKPPSSHVGTLKRHIYFGYDQERRSVVIGPVIFPGKSGRALPALEYGGKSDRHTGETIHVRARPFMGPAFSKELAIVPGLWADIVK